MSLFAGAPMAPVIAVQSGLVAQLAPRDQLAESFTWVSTCLLGGVGAGIAAGGMLVELWSPGWVLAVAAGSTALAGIISYRGLPGTISAQAQMPLR